jgi:uncharacterized membrane protein
LPEYKPAEPARSEAKPSGVEKVSSDEVGVTGPYEEPPRIKPPPALVTAVGIGALLATVYPPAAERALLSVGVRPVAWVLLGIGAVSLLAWKRLDATGRVPVTSRAALLLLPAASVVTGGELFLRLVPAAIQLGIAALFLHSLQGGGSLFLDAARSLHPYAPDFIAPYCRKSTALFAGIFIAQGLGVAWLAFHPEMNDPSWGFASGVLVWIPTLVATGADWLVRKWWFRYYGPGPVDRVLRILLPPENTEAGRRSLEYIRRMRAELGMPPP